MKEAEPGRHRRKRCFPPEKPKFKTRCRYYCKASYAPIGYKTFRFFSAARLLSESLCSPTH